MSTRARVVVYMGRFYDTGGVFTLPENRVAGADVLLEWLRGRVRDIAEVRYVKPGRFDALPYGGVYAAATLDLHTLARNLPGVTDVTDVIERQEVVHDTERLNVIQIRPGGRADA